MFNYKIDKNGNIIEELIGQNSEDYIQSTIQIDATKMIYDLSINQFKEKIIMHSEELPNEKLVHIMTKEELINVLNIDYQRKLDENYKNYIIALMEENEERKTYLVQERKDIKASYESQKETIMNS